MSYAGICGAENLQSRSDAYFHTKTYDDIMAHINDPGGGDRCGSKTTTDNTTPTVSAGASHTIPGQTPFTLTGLGADADGDSLTYAWEQFNLGEASPPNTDDGSRPLFRSLPPAGRPDRTFPQINDILNTTTTLGESLPTTNRTLTFRLTVRDNRGGVNHASVAILVTTSAGPFRVTGLNTAVVWAAQSTQRVTWDVAGTTAAPVSCPNVDILLSVNGGMTFDTILADDTPNDGSQNIVAPTSNTSAARLKIACANNIFFDIGDNDFAITASTAQKVYLPQILR